MTELTRNDVHRLGGRYVAYKLEQAGFRVEVQKNRLGRMVENRKGRAFSLAVRTLQEPYVLREREGPESRIVDIGYGFSVKSKADEFYAFVALDLERLIILPRHELYKHTLNRFPISAFNAPREKKDIEMLRSLTTP